MNVSLITSPGTSVTGVYGVGGLGRGGVVVWQPAQSRATIPTKATDEMNPFTLRLKNDPDWEFSRISLHFGLIRVFTPGSLTGKINILQRSTPPSASASSAD